MVTQLQQVRRVTARRAYQLRGRYYYQPRLERAARRVVDASVPPSTAFRDVSDDEWYWAHTYGTRQSQLLREVLPGLPAVETQQQFTGNAGQSTLEEGFRAYLLFKEIVATHRRPLSEDDTVLDYGCGWGRIIRFFSRDVAPDHLLGIDCYEEVLRFCESSNRWATFRLVDPLPPSPLEPSSLDVVYAYSVFSHLAEEAHRRWLEEFHRLLRPGGLLIATTWQRDWIVDADERARRERPDWLVSDAPTFADPATSLSEYDAGHYVYSPIGGGGPLDSSFFGETCISEAYARSHWTDLFDIVEYIDDRTRCPQNVIVARRGGVSA